MRTSRGTWRLGVSAILATALALAGCEEEEGQSAKAASAESKQGTAKAEASPKKSEGCEAIAGRYKVTDTIEGGSCEEPTKKVVVSLDLKQTGCEVVATIEGLVELKGPVHGRTAHLKGSYEEEGTITKDLKITFAADGKVSGSGKWTYATSGFKCGGTSTFEGKRR